MNRFNIQSILINLCTQIEFTYLIGLSRSPISHRKLKMPLKTFYSEEAKQCFHCSLLWFAWRRIVKSKLIYSCEEIMLSAVQNNISIYYVIVPQYSRASVAYMPCGKWIIPKSIFTWILNFQLRYIQSLWIWRD